MSDLYEAGKSRAKLLNAYDGRQKLEYSQGFVENLDDDGIIKLLGFVEAQCLWRGIGAYAGTKSPAGAGSDPGDEQP